MRRLALVPLLLLTLPADARRKKDPLPVVQKVPSIEEVVTKEGFVPTPSQSETYRPGVVLVPNAQGGHDVVHPDCIGAEPDISIMSQSSIATSLSAGVSARLAAARGQAAAGVEKRLSFVDPEQRTIPFSALNPSEDCAAGLETAARFTDLTQAILVYDVLVAQIQNTVCTKADASGSVMMLGEAEAAAYSECVQESDAQVPLGFKFVPLSQVFTSAGAVSLVPAQVISGQPAAASASVDFGTPSALGIDDQLAEQECDRRAAEKGAAARAARLSDAEGDARVKASEAWRSLQGDLEKCTQLPHAQRGRCAQAAEQWLSQARAMPVSIPAGVEPIETACGLKQPAFAADSRTVMADEVASVEAMLVRLQAPDGVAAGAGWTGRSGYAMVGIPAGSFTMGSPSSEKGRDDDETQHRVTFTKGFLMGKTEVTQGLWRSAMGSNPSVKDYKGVSLVGDSLPVQNVDWCDAVAFANKLSARDGLSAAYSGVDQCKTSKGISVDWDRSSDGYRLPTEAEWEYAARAGEHRLFSGAESYEKVCGVGNVSDLGAKAKFSWSDDWSTQCSDRHHALAPVGAYSANGWGVHDMTGNVWEWCWDWKADYSGTSTDPVGPQSGTYRVYRGGSWGSIPRNARVANRFRSTPDIRNRDLGLRLVRTSP